MKDFQGIRTVTKQEIPIVLPFSVFTAAGVTFAVVGAVENKIRIAGADLTSTYTAGKILYFTQAATVKYFYIASSVLNGADTDVTLTPLDGAVLTTGAITLPFIGTLGRSEPCIYSAADKIKFVGIDLTAKYIAGKIIRFYQGTTEKIFVVASSAYNASDTTVTLTSLNSTTVANAAITEQHFCAPAAAGVTFVYIGIPNKIQVTGTDVTADYTAGVLVRFTQDTVIKNFETVSSALVGSDTVITLSPTAGAIVSKTAITVPLIGNTTATTVTDVTECDGEIKRLIFTVPALDSTNTATLDVKDANGVVFFTTGAKAHTAAYIYEPSTLKELLLSGNFYFTITVSAAQTAPRTFNVELYSK